MKFREEKSQTPNSRGQKSWYPTTYIHYASYYLAHLRRYPPFYPRRLNYVPTVDASASEALEVDGALTDNGIKACSFLQLPSNTLFSTAATPIA